MTRKRAGLALAVLALLGGAAMLGLALLGGPGDPRAAYARAAEAYDAGDMRAARVELLNAVQADPDFGAAYLLQARVLNALGEGRNAEAAVTRARAAGVPVAATRHILSEALLDMGQADAALAEAGAADIPREHRGDAARIRANALVALGDFDAAADAYDEALVIDARVAALWVDIGRFRLATGHRAGALEASARAVALGPRDVDALLRGELARSQYGLAAALPWFDRALAIDRDSLPALIEKAATLGEAGRMREMLATARRVLELQPGNFRATYMLAVLAARARDYDLARALLQRTGGAIDGVPAVALLQGALEYEAGNYQRAGDRLGALIEAQPANLAAQRLYGAARFGSGDMQAALAALLPLALRADAGSYVLTLVGRAYERLGDRPRAAFFLERATLATRGAAAPLAPVAITDADLARHEREARDIGGADAETALIRVYLRLGRAEDALARARLLRDAHHGAPAAHILVGDALGALGRFADAARAYAGAANIGFTEAVALRMIEALSRAGEPEEAHRVLTLYLGQNPRSVPAGALAADLFMREGQWREAIATLEALRARIGGRDAALMANLGWAYHHAGDAARAEVFARRAYLLMPMSPIAAERYGWIALVDADRRRLGLALLEKARDLAPGDPAIQWRLGRAYAALGQRESARRAIRLALASDAFGEREAATALLGRL